MITSELEIELAAALAALDIAHCLPSYGEATQKERSKQLAKAARLFRKASDRINDVGFSVANTGSGRGAVIAYCVMSDVPAPLPLWEKSGRDE